MIPPAVIEQIGLRYGEDFGDALFILDSLLDNPDREEVPQEDLGWNYLNFVRAILYAVPRYAWLVAEIERINPKNSGPIINTVDFYDI